jgi:hypothetical protein
VQLSKEKLGLQAKVDVAKYMDMHIKVKQVGAKMREQITIVFKPFFDFMDCFKFLKFIVWF